AEEFLPKKATHCGRTGEAQRNPPFQADMERPEAMYAPHKRTSENPGNFFLTKIRVAVIYFLSIVWQMNAIY
ncbi:MAG: hypothetical protein DRI57_31745, partial [Deltaproteobacteria bacterium]